MFGNSLELPAVAFKTSRAPGKMSQVSQVSMPHAPGAAAVWTVSTYDALGRTVSVAQPGGSGTKNYSYSGRTVTATDEAGKWKKFTMDALGNLTQVNEPNPAGGSEYVTSYTYDVLNHLVGVSMPRTNGGTTYTQTRTFNYGTPPGAYLLSATNPETGTVSYSYANGKLAAKTDAKNQQVEYAYDSYGRVTQVRHYPVAGGAEDVCQQGNFTYDAGLDGSFSYRNIQETTACVGRLSLHCHVDS